MKYCNVCEDEIDLDISEEWTKVTTKSTLINDSIIETTYYCSDECFDATFCGGLVTK